VLGAGGVVEAGGVDGGGGVGAGGVGGATTGGAGGAGGGAATMSMWKVTGPSVPPEPSETERLNTSVPVVTPA
jgi:hypothetical protein